MKAEHVNSISHEVYRRFPEFKGVHPKVTQQPGSASAAYLLVFQARVQLSDGKVMSRRVRVLADERGKVIKMTTSK